jgi:hypothetical protein
MTISVWLILNAVVVFVGIVVLWWCRDRSRKATRVGTIALCGYGLLTLLPFAPLAVAQFGLGSLPGEVGAAFAVAHMIGWPLCLLLLVVAIIIDRQP